jgi:hypothetical protein
MAATVVIGASAMFRPCPGSSTGPTSIQLGRLDCHLQYTDALAPA